MLRRIPHIAILMLFVITTSASCRSHKSIIENNYVEESPLTGRRKVVFEETFFGGLAAKYDGDYKRASTYSSNA